jgi:hypothetical protein
MAAHHAIGRAVSDEVLSEIDWDLLDLAAIPNVSVDAEAKGTVSEGERGHEHHFPVVTIPERLRSTPRQSTFRFGIKQFPRQQARGCGDASFVSR